MDSLTQQRELFATCLDTGTLMLSLLQSFRQNYYDLRTRIVVDSVISANSLYTEKLIHKTSVTITIDSWSGSVSFRVNSDNRIEQFMRLLHLAAYKRFDYVGSQMLTLHICLKCRPLRRFLLYRHVGQFIGNRYSAGNPRVKKWLDNVRCNGTEMDIADCQHDRWGTYSCDYRELVSVSCYTNSK